MKRFSFRLERLLELRHRQERDLQQQLATINRQQELIKTKIRQVSEQQRRIQTAQRSALVGKVVIEDLRMHAGIAQQQDAFVRQLVEELARAEPARQVAQASLLRATAARRALERLREKAHTRWIQSCRRSERREEGELLGVGAPE